MQELHTELYFSLFYLFGMSRRSRLLRKMLVFLFVFGGATPMVYMFPLETHKTSGPTLSVYNSKPASWIATVIDVDCSLIGTKKVRDLKMRSNGHVAIAGCFRCLLFDYSCLSNTISKWLPHGSPSHPLLWKHMAQTDKHQ